jgi:S-adenosylmethionine:tRNA ribosyltransferase-isomerase
MIKRSEFHFNLPDKSIAKYPLADRASSKLLVHRSGESSFHTFSEIAEHLASDSLLVMNNAKVIPARLYFKRSSGALIEVLLVEPYTPANYEEAFNATHKVQWKCIIGNSKKWKDQETIYLEAHPELASAVLKDREERIVELSWTNGSSFSDLLSTIGELPLPPYLNRATEESDTTNYQTIFAKNEGSVAAPTAGLHFTPEVLDRIKTKKIRTTEVTLHVGAGTFLPVKADNVLDHEMHREHFEITIEALEALLDSSSRIAVGTTSLRLLESLYWLGVQISNGSTDLLVKKLEPYEIKSKMSYNEALQAVHSYVTQLGKNKLVAATEILILPHYTPRSIVGLITNFHLPESTLLMLIASVVGDNWRTIYDEALQNEFRFLSYGDSSLLFVE